MLDESFIGADAGLQMRRKLKAGAPAARSASPPKKGKIGMCSISSLAPEIARSVVIDWAAARKRGEADTNGEIRSSVRQMVEAVDADVLSPKNPADIDFKVVPYVASSRRSRTALDPTDQADGPSTTVDCCDDDRTMPAAAPPSLDSNAGTSSMTHSSPLGVMQNPYSGFCFSLCFILPLVYQLSLPRLQAHNRGMRVHSPPLGSRRVRRS